MRKSADVVVIGGGSIGCSVAYYLAKKGFKNIVLLEKRYITSGSTGRCGAGIRQQWGTEMNCLISRGSAEIWKTIGEETGYGDIEFRQSGYLLITYDEKQAERLTKNLEVQHRLGIPSRKVSKEEAKEIVPHINTENMTAAFFCQEDGHINPFKATFAYEKGARDLGVEIEKYTTVTGIKREGRKIVAVVTDKGEIETNTVVNATGPYAKEIGKMLGLSHPVEPERHQLMVTEPMEHMVDPLVMSFHHDSYINQVPHGGFLLGFGNPDEPKKINYKHEWKFIEDMAKKALYQFPDMKDLRVVRQWAGHYGISPDGQPILGPVPEVDGYFLALGCGKGFMLAPMIGKLVAECMAGEETSLPIEKLSIERFAKGELIVETGVV
ncbi:sarcosine oxidase subunit beta [Dethiosulfatibacter aminovorans DSM 17477]|uniref:Sarcosine oxidase subunit beta n=1 Tax=Dethiosulfatibacter aminovorans DSM 17477 TaxID=1121476 RepID=A0A1M6K9V8_9FIRM|nr:FAD-binding oxidoreductase [Dethiosulfatibacter aminovorans]SHJ55702.1 sarcosine oxidase subunit beta [Dethiosulfatibacter aminovorans DSM 17477]